MSSISHQTISSYVDTDRTILSFLGPRDLVRCAGVCQTWHALTEEDDLWRHAIPGISKFVGTNIKQWVNCRVVTSDKTLLRNFEQFITNLRWNEYSKFQCVFPSNPNCLLVVRLACGSTLLNQDPDRHYICLSLKEQPKVDGLHDFLDDIFPMTGCSTIMLPEHCAIREIYTHYSFTAHRQAMDHSDTALAMQGMMEKRIPNFPEDYPNLAQMGWKDFNYRTPAHIAKAAVAAQALGGNLSL